jgi:predicted branched-subunit amino acid permease
MGPILLGVVPFATVAGAAGVQNGLSVTETICFSLLSFSGAAQIVSSDLLGGGADLWVVVVTAQVINLRFLLYSVALSRLLPPRKLLGRLGAAYLITDHAYALVEQRSSTAPRQRHGAATQWPFYLGAALAFWVPWQLCNLAGALVGSRMPTDSALTFAVPLSFLALLVPALVSAPRVAAALVAGVVSLAALRAPAHSSVVLAIVLGMVGGLLVSRRQRSTGATSIEGPGRVDG